MYINWKPRSRTGRLSSKSTNHLCQCGILFIVIKTIKELRQMKELVMNLQGILCNFDLPPFLTNLPWVHNLMRQNRLVLITLNRNLLKQIKYVHQSATLTGINTSTFDDCVKGITKIYTYFSWFLPANKLQPCSMIDYFREYSSIEMSNCYFMSRKDNPQEQNIPLAMTSIQTIYFQRLQAGYMYMVNEILWKNPD